MMFRIVMATVLALAVCWGCTTSEQQQQGREFYLFVGTYTGEASKGIYLYKFNVSDGTTDSLGLAAETANPSYLALSPDENYLYAVSEMADPSEATVSAFAFDRQEERLRYLNSVSSQGGAPCYVSVDTNGRTVFAGNYLEGSLAVFPVEEDGSLQESKTVVEHEGSSADPSRQKQPHVHCTYISPDNRYLFVADLGTDELKTYNFYQEQVALATKPTYVYETEPGAGPRHLTFHPNGEFAYLVNELNGTVVALDKTGRELHPIEIVSTLPEDYDGAISGADIHVSPDGRYLYVSNREDLNNIVIYAISQETGELDKIDQISTGGVHPRNITIDPTGNYLLVANRHSDNVVIFKRDMETGGLTPTGTELNISQPVCLKMAAAE
ncbi:MAG: lactonase family protein [Balneolaceae bacterium]|nr:lactonase family protein [Balneolaceae bacterium]